MRNIHIAIIGTGAVGGYYGALLQRAGFHVHFLLRSDFTFVRDNGLHVASPNGTFDLPKVSAYDQPADMPRCDLVFICLKTTENQQLKDILPSVIKDNSYIITLQNGLGNEEVIAEYTNQLSIFGGLCFLCCNKVGPGSICHLDYGLITLGAYSPSGEAVGCTPELEEISTILRKAGIDVQMIPHLAHARWKKLVWNIPFNGLCVVHDCLTDHLLDNPETRALCRTLMHETAEASAACSQPIDEAFIEKMISDTEKMTPYAPSMKLDHDRGRKMEIESIYGIPLARAREQGVDMPSTTELYHQLRQLA